MAFLNICGFATGDTSELASTSGTCSVQSSVKRTGSYAFRVNPATTSTGYGTLKGLDSHGNPANFNVATLYGTVYFRIDASPTTNGQYETFIRFKDTAGGTKLEGLLVKQSYGTYLYFSVGGGYNVYVADGAFHKLEWAIGTGTTAAVTIKVDDTVIEQSASYNTGTTNHGYIELGKVVNTYGYSVDWYYDDIAISDSAYPGAGQVNILKPNGDGYYTAWTGSYTDVDEVPHDSDTTYIWTTAGGAAKQSVALESCATGGVGGTIGVVKACYVSRKTVHTDGSGLYGKWRSATGPTDDWVTPDGFNPDTSFVFNAGLRETDPGTGAAWTTGDVDALELVIQSNASPTQYRCTAICAMVWCTGNTAPTITGAPSATYALGLAATPDSTWGVTFTASDAEQTGANALTYYVRDSATWAAGNQIATGTCTSGTQKAVTGLNLTYLVNGLNTLYLHIYDGTDHTASASSFTVNVINVGPEEEGIGRLRNAGAPQAVHRASYR